jgi:uncharacterized delta-60 repeat protein
VVVRFFVKALGLLSLASWVSGCSLKTAIEDLFPDIRPLATVADVTLTEGGTANLVIQLSEPHATEPIVISYSSSDGLASSTLDYATLTGTVTIPAGQISATIALSAPTDSWYEGNEDFDVTLLSSTNVKMSAQSKKVWVTDLQTQPTVEFQAATSSVAENVVGGSHTVTAVLSGDVQRPVTVNFSRTSGTALTPTDYSMTTSGILTFPGGGALTLTLPAITVVDDSLYDGNKTINFALTGPSSNATLGSQGTHAVTITDNEPNPQVEFSVPTSVASENVGVHNITVQLNTPAAAAITVAWIIDGSGSTASGGGTDYTSTTGGTFTFASGETIKTIPITVINDLISEPSETIFFVLSSPGGGASLGTNVNHVFTITDNDGLPDVSLPAATASVNENVMGGIYNVVVSLTNPSSANITVDYATANGTGVAGSDYTATSGTLTFTPGQTVRTVPVTITNDSLYEGNENFTFTISNKSVNSDWGAHQSTTITIVDDETMPTVQFALAADTVGEGAGTANTVVVLSGPSATAVTVNYVSANGTATAGSDYTAVSSTLTIAAAATVATIPVTITDDLDYESSETLTLTLSSPVGATLGMITTHTRTILDNEGVPELNFASATGSTNENVAGGLGSVVATLSGPSGSNLVVTYTVANGTALGAGTDFTFASGTFTIIAGSTTHTLAPTIVNDAIAEGAESFTITLASVSSGGVLGSTTVHTHTINDDESTPTLQFASATSAVNENVGTHNILVNLSGAASTDVVFTLTRSGTATEGGGNDYTDTGLTYTITAGQTVSTVTVTVIDDTLGEPAETAIYDIATVTGGGGVTEGTPGTHTMTINASDTPTLQFAAGTSSVAENVGGSTHNVLVTLSNVASADVTFTVAVGGGSTAATPSDYTVTTGTLTVPAGQTVLTVPVTLTNDNVHEASETLALTVGSPSANATLGTPSTHTVTITDDDTAPTIQFQAATSTAAESVGSHTIVITLSRPADQAVVINFANTGTATSGGTDYTSPASPLTVPALATVYNHVLTVNDDLMVESAETVIVTLSSIASGPGSLSGTLVHTFTITDNDFTPFTWLGTTGDGLWSTTGNWSSGVVPGPSDVARFNAACGSNCNASVNVAATGTSAIKGLVLESTYTGTLTNNNVLEVRDDHLTIAGGTFVNASGRVLDLNGNFVQSGGTFTNSNTAASGFLISGNFTRSGGTYTAGGSITIDGTTAATFDPSNASVGALIIAKTNANTEFVSNMNVANDLQLNSGTGLYTSANGSRINVIGNVVGTSGFGGGTSGLEINFAASSGTQTITAAGGMIFPSIKINTGGTLDLGSQTIDVSNHWIYQAGTVNAGTSTVRFIGDANSTITTAGMGFNNLEVGPKANSRVITLGSDVIVNGNFLKSSVGLGVEYRGSFAYRLRGNANFNFGGGGFEHDLQENSFVFDGASGTQTISGNGEALIPNANFNSTSNIVLSGTLFFTGNLTYTAATSFVATGSTARTCCGNLTTVNTGTAVFGNFTFGNSWSGANVVGTLNVGGNLTLMASNQNQAYNGGLVKVAGNVIMSDAFVNGGTLSIELNGTGNQTITRVAGTWPSGTITVNKASGRVLQASDISFNSTGQDLVFAQAGTWDMASYNLTVNDQINGSAGPGTIYRQCGTLTRGSIVPTVNVIDGNFGTTATIANAAAVTEGSPSNFVVTLNQANCSAITFDYSTVNGTAVGGNDFTAAASQSFTIPASTTVATVAVATTNDTTYEITENFTLTTTNVAGMLGSGFTGSPVTGTINDNDTAPQVSWAAASASVSEGVGTQNIVAQLTNPSYEVVRANFSTSGTALGSGTDYLLPGSSVTFAAGTTVQTIVATINDDSVRESSETLILTLTGVSTGTATVGAPSAHTLTINDNDAIPFTWVGTAADGQWTTPGNWTGGVVPGPYDTARFASGCGANCNVTVGSNQNVGGLSLEGSYTGTVTVSSTLNVIDGGVTIAGGTLSVSGTVASVNANFTQSGGTFTNTGKLWVGSPLGLPTFVTRTAGTFTSTFGDLEIGGISDVTVDLAGDWVRDLILQKNGDSSIIFTGTLNVNSDLQILNTASDVQMIGGTVNLLRNTVTSSGRRLNGGTTNLVFYSSGVQAWQGRTNVVYPSIQIDKWGGGSVNLDDSLGPIDIAKNFICTGGTFNAGASKARFVGTTPSTFSTGFVTCMFYDLDLRKVNSGVTNIGSSFVTNDVTIDQPGASYVTSYTNGGRLYIGRHLNMVANSTTQFLSTADPLDNNIFFHFGSGATHNVTGVPGAVMGSLTVESSDTVNLFGTIDVQTHVEISGRLNAGTSHVRLMNNDTSQRMFVTDPSDGFYDLSFLSNDAAIFLTSGTDINVFRNLVFGGAGYLGRWGGTEGFNVYGNVSSQDTFQIAYADLTFRGPNIQTVTYNAGRPFYRYEIDKSGGRVVQGSFVNIWGPSFYLEFLQPGIWDTNGLGFETMNQVLGTGVIYQKCGYMALTNGVAAGVQVINGNFGTAASLLDASAAEGSALAFRIVLNQPNCNEIIFNYETLLSGTATSGVDYTAVSSTSFTIPAGQTTASITVSSTSDTDLEGDEGLELQVLKSSIVNMLNDNLGAGGMSFPAGNPIANGIIQDDDIPTWAYAVPSYTVREGVSVAPVVLLSNPRATNVTFNWTTTNGTAVSGSDFTTNSGTATILAGQTVVTLPAVVTIDDAPTADASEYFTVNMSSLSGATWVGMGADVTQIELVDTSTLPTINISSPVAVTEGSPISFVVTLSTAAPLDVTFNYATSNNTAVAPGDFTAVTTTSGMISAGNSVLTIPNVVTINDTSPESTETFNMILSSLVNAQAGTVSGLGSIADNDTGPTGITISNLVASSVTSTGFTATVTFTGDSNSNSGLTLEYCNETDSAGCAASTSLGAMTRGVGVFTLNVTGLSLPNDPGDTLTLRVVATDADGTSGTPLAGTVQLLPQLNIEQLARVEGQGFEFIVTINRTTAQNVTFSYTSGNGTAIGGGTDFNHIGPAAGLIPAGQTVATLPMLTTTDDADVEATEAFTVTLSSPVNASLGTATATGYIVDNDSAGVWERGFDGTVNRTLVDGLGRVLAVGGFTVWDDTINHHGARINGLDGGKEDMAYPLSSNGVGFDASVLAAVRQPDGKMLVGGVFITYRGVSRNRIARLHDDGTLDTTFDPGSGANDQINSIALLPDGRIVIGGYFTSFNGTSRPRIAILQSNGALDTSFVPIGGSSNGLNSYVDQVVVQPDGKIIAVGDFTNFNVVTSRSRIVRFELNGSIDSSFNPGAGFNLRARSIVLRPNGRMLVAGEFTSYDGTGRNRIAQVRADGTLDTGFDPGTGFDAWTQGLALQSDGQVLVGGNFSTFNATSRGRIARLDASGSLDTGFATGSGFSGGAVNRVAVLPTGNVLVAGSFTFYNGGSPRRSFASLTSSGNLESRFVPGEGANNTINSMVVAADNRVYLYGNFSSYYGFSRNMVARLNPDHSLDQTFNPGSGANNTVRAVAVDTNIGAPNFYYLVGDLTTFNGVPVTRIARLNSGGALSMAGFTIGTGFTGGAVNDVRVQGDGKLIVAGAFTSYNSVTRRQIVRLNTDGTNDATFDSGTGTGGFSILSLALNPDGKIYIGGTFTAYNGTSSNSLARLNTDGSIDTGFNMSTGVTGATTAVNSMVIQGDDKLIIGGDFTSVVGTSRSRIARLNTNGTLDTSFNPGTGANIGVSAVGLQQDGRVLVGGGFTTYNATSRNRIIRVNTDGSLDTGFNPSGGSADVVTHVNVASDGRLLLAGSRYIQGPWTGGDNSRQLHSLLPVANISIGNLRIVADGLGNKVIRLGFYGDTNENSTAMLYYCNHTTSPGCNPTTGTALPMTTSTGVYNGDFSVSIPDSAFTATHTYNLRVVVTDTDGVVGSPINTSSVLLP